MQFLNWMISKKALPNRVQYKDVKPGQWLIKATPVFDARVVSIELAYNLPNTVRIETDYGNGGDPAISYLPATAWCNVSHIRP